MLLPQQNQFAVSAEKQGPKKIAKASFPLRYGKYSEIKTAEYEFCFNLNGEIKFIRGLSTNWPHPAEQLKRTDGNDWVYYTVGDKSGNQGVKSWMGEYYLPCLPYSSNAVWDVNYFADTNVMQAFGAWAQLYGDLYCSKKETLHPRAKEAISLILKSDDNVLHERAKKLINIIGGRISVLPPDTRHADYEVIPLMVADGCQYKCDFCCVKTAQNYKPRTKQDINEQIRNLKAFYGRNIENYNALFLGNHDALGAGEELILLAASEAFAAFKFGSYYTETPILSFFSSVDTLLKTKPALIEKLNALPFRTFINIGFESMDETTLKDIGKPLSGIKVREALKKMQDINAAYANIEITGNFLLGETLSDRHYESLAEFLKNSARPLNGKGAIYMSPIKDSPKKRELLPKFFEIKKQSQVPVYIYLIQRL